MRGLSLSDPAFVGGLGGVWPFVGQETTLNPYSGNNATSNVPTAIIEEGDLLVAVHVQTYWASGFANVTNSLATTGWTGRLTAAWAGSGRATCVYWKIATASEASTVWIRPRSGLYTYTRMGYTTVFVLRNTVTTNPIASGAISHGTASSQGSPETVDITMPDNFGASVPYINLQVTAFAKINTSGGLPTSLVAPAASDEIFATEEVYTDLSLYRPSYQLIAAPSGPSETRTHEAVGSVSNGLLYAAHIPVDLL